MDVSLKVAENKVPGCLSTVHVHASVVESEEDEVQEGMRVRYSGDSDGLLTKGLVSLLVRGLSECTASQIQLVDPAFIQEAGIAASLTPGRNNGFLNMLAVMKRKAREAEQQALEARQTKTSREAARSEVSQRSTAVGSTKRSNGRRPKYDAMMRALQSQLHPVRLELVDKSHEHTGHAGSQGLDGESHFDLYVVSKEFDGLNMIKRHRLVYATLGDVMPTIHALQIRAQTPAEAGLSHEVL
jgi:stress-induced morphogen/sulfur transfer protein SufE